ncbi:DUF896 domain-containing protein [Vallitalea sp.]|jgi:uncharacterized protein YnzC (UPF0291/DUF896 family)|uniref:DUF896 domain-containing protein n=1 Tax=Vallitalea sp. TaxID=1882829 RepID=UPI0025D1085B|nr:DUF896 domain-containing protein [Vallitalea sp.]MCT4688372.1 DUF896 domain-containing protein [Vallitalea sp.]
MEKKKIDRINELYKKNKIEGLTDEEKIEQSLLREEYLNAVRKNFKSTMSTIKLKDEKGNITPLKPKHKK